MSHSSTNRPFYGFLLSCLAFEWKWGWRWPCFDRNLPTFHVDAVLMLISRNLHMERSEVSIKTRSTPASLSFKGQATKHNCKMVYYWGQGWCSGESTHVYKRKMLIVVNWMGCFFAPMLQLCWQIIRKDVFGEWKRINAA